MAQSVDDLFGNFISPKRVFCGGLFTDPSNPPNNYEPTTPPQVDEDTVDKTNGTLTRSKTSSVEFIIKLSELIGVDLDHSHDHNVTITFDNAKIVKLANIFKTGNETIFKTDGIPKWIQQQWRLNRCVHMITGYILVGKTHLDENGNTLTKFDGTITINVGDALTGGAATAASAVVKALGIGDPLKLGSVTGEAKGSVGNGGKLTYDLTEPTILAITYRKVHYIPDHSVFASYGLFGPMLDHLEAKTKGLGSIQPGSLRISEHERSALYLPTRGV
ncbi:hypothetical protein BCR39DRAFT_588438 [Naematelia encephala]|uniref:Uncharacterized protein n=1 Tax=Naematelia encephala TaxID=71784 RepID=A0A1Y2B2T1_9TREE|nr:hypothetical protein BCR39DRAFT_588438 [Naematelia encephala]